ncbi:two-component system response regulator NarL [Pelagibaculum spongiae]|uniref:Two-component system response regulator NarL n=1 Tax=Pelagibaculum spongiae TaxID=2080658 RepID=A0A2V1H254_9GAMM|nr:two-component system response regulator NarL [Pelagibaculum spongiae]PVZ68986.1 two-component system response regulator NarL [Pelagibaculum spongiae]
MDKCTILLVDDHPLLRQGVNQLIQMEPGLEVIGQSGKGEEAIELALQHEPDLVLLDLNMKGMTGLDTLKEMRRRGIASRIVILTVSDNQADVVSCLKAGADGYLLKDMEPEELLANLVEAASGKMVISDELGQILAQALRDRQSGHKMPSIHQLTQRERDILRLIAKGLSNKRIALKLDITEGTVKVHVKSILKKLQVRSRVEAAVWCVESNFS